MSYSCIARVSDLASILVTNSSITTFLLHLGVEKREKCIVQSTVLPMLTCDVKSLRLRSQSLQLRQNDAQRFLATSSQYVNRR